MGMVKVKDMLPPRLEQLAKGLDVDPGEFVG
jgi:hypothetical protein